MSTSETSPDVKKRVLKRRRRERGIALIMVLGAIAVLTVMLAEFQEETSATLAEATADRDSAQAEYFARSAVNLSRLLVAAEPTLRGGVAPILQMMGIHIHQLPVWAFTDKLLGAFNDEEASKDFAGTAGLDMSLSKNLGLKGGRFEVQIVDEDAKINVNTGASNTIMHQRLAGLLMAQMAPLNLNPIFEAKDITGNFNTRLETCAAIIDWADIDEMMWNCDPITSASGNSSSGAEDGYYQYLPKPYRRKNAPYDSLDELHLVRGVSDDFWTAIVDPDPTNPKKRNITVWGTGKVNINAANPQTLLALICSGVSPMEPLCSDPMQMSLFITGVTMFQGISMGIPVFGSPQDLITLAKGQGQVGPMMVGMGLHPVSKFLSEKDFASSIGLESKVFSIYAVGVVKGYKRETRTSITTVVDFTPAPSATGSSGAPAPSSSASAANPAASAISQMSSASSPNALAAALGLATGGNILYYHIE